MSDEYHFEVKKKRPEESFENAIEYFKGKRLIEYAKSKSMMLIQEKLTIRALELLNLPKISLILDLGCGPGFTSIYLKEMGYKVVAMDIVSEFLNFYDIKELNPINADMCEAPFKANAFDAIISISAIQWIFTDINNILMKEKMINFAKSISYILKPDSKAIFQFYPKNDTIMKAIGKIIAENTDLNGNFIIDNPINPIKRNIFLFLKKK